MKPEPKSLDGQSAPSARASLTPASGLGLVASCAVLFFGAGLALSAGDPVWALTLVPLAAFLLPVVLYARLHRSEALVFPSSRLSWRSAGVAASLVLGGSLAALAAAGAVSRWTGPGGDEALLAALVARFSPPLRLLLFILLPALCEEALFRGALLAAIRRWGCLPACVTSGLLFGLFHGSLQRLLPVALLGCALAAVVWLTGNLWLAASGHALHNLLVLSALHYYGAGGMPSPGALAAWAACGLVLIGTGVVLGRRRREGEAAT